ncbi:MAG TPA: hypothetical protein VFA85_03795 [Terriglobales bacterium]|nr:hypothetical protein [Terriglobales bacterium]
MKALFGVGLIVLILGILAFFVPVPHTEHHGINAGDVQFGVDTHHSQVLPPVVGIALVIVGGALMIAGRKKA